MGLFSTRRQPDADVYRFQRELLILSDLFVRRARRMREGRSEWEQAWNLLREVYTREAARTSFAVGRRMQYLEVPEPQPALEDVLPEDALEAAKVVGPACVISE